jgi:aldehyde dehydrogenase (NAD+)
MLDKRDFYINGKWIAPAAPRDLEVIDPSTEGPCAVISLGDQADTDAAVQAARTAFATWSLTSKSERLGLLKALLKEYRRRQDEMAAAISLEMGAPIDMATKQQATTGEEIIEQFIETLESFEFESTPWPQAPDERIFKEPIGVCGLITPWNWPINQVALKVVPALAAGCTVVLKPSEIAPLSSLLLAEMLDAIGCPPGVFNLVNGDGPGVGSQLSAHPDVDMISFTGSTRAGRLISKAAADTIKRVTLELGGKGANIVFADADEAAVKRGVRLMMNNTGQSCNAPSRMLVERSYYDEAVDIAADTANMTSVGPSAEHGRHIGPLASAAQFEKVQGLVETGIKEGARLVAGGLGRPEGLNRGFFARPTIFADVNNDMTIAREEIFGPVLVMIPFEDEAEAVRIANDTVYGLTNYVQTQNGERANRVGRALRSGMVRINGTSSKVPSSFGGYKQSGNGREGGPWGMDEFLEVKHATGWAKWHD